MESLPADDHTALRDGLGLGRTKAQGAMRAGPVVVVEVLAQGLDQVALAQDDQPSRHSRRREPSTLSQAVLA